MLQNDAKVRLFPSSDPVPKPRKLHDCYSMVIFLSSWSTSRCISRPGATRDRYPNTDIGIPLRDLRLTPDGLLVQRIVAFRHERGNCAQERRTVHSPATKRRRQVRNGETDKNLRLERLCDYQSPQPLPNKDASPDHGRHYQRRRSQA